MTARPPFGVFVGERHHACASFSPTLIPLRSAASLEASSKRERILLVRCSLSASRLGAFGCAKICFTWSGIFTLLSSLPLPSDNHSIWGRFAFNFRIAVAGPKDSACCPITLSCVGVLTVFLGEEKASIPPDDNIKAPIVYLPNMTIL